MTPERETNKLFVGNLSRDTKRRDLKDFFAQFGEVAFTSTAFDKEKRRPRGFGFVTFENEADAAKAKDAAEDGGLVLHERTLFLEYALPRTDRQEDKLKNPDSKNDSTIKQATDTIKNAAENIENTVEKTINEAQDIVEDIID